MATTQPVPMHRRFAGGAEGGLPRSLTAAESAALQSVADKTGLPFSLVGARGGQAGVNIDSALPFGAGDNQRSPIELAFPAEYDLLTSGGFTETLYETLDALLHLHGADRAYYQASHLWPPETPSVDFYPRNERREVIARRADWSPIAAYRAQKAGAAGQV